MSLYNTLKKTILDILFPVTCLGCRQEDTWLCHNCWKKISINQSQVCPICRATNNGSVCGICQDKIYLDGLLIATDYKNTLTQSLIHTLKYNFIQEITKSLSQLLINFIESIDRNNKLTILTNPEDAVITVVPLHKKRLLERGFNQSELLAEQTARYFSFEFQPQLLKRYRYTEAQAQLPRQERLKNVLDAFTLYRKFDLSNKNVIIIDDVATTLATMNECAKVLKKANCQNVWGLVIARG